jgi:hypothetical protein
MKPRPSTGKCGAPVLGQARFVTSAGSFPRREAESAAMIAWAAALPRVPDAPENAGDGESGGPSRRIQSLRDKL